MKMKIRSRGIELPEEFRSHAERRLQFALGRFGRRIAFVRVTVWDANGPRGGIDKRCRVEVRLLPRGQVVLTDSHADPQAALDRTADRVSRQVARSLERKSWSRAIPVPATVDL